MSAKLGLVIFFLSASLPASFGQVASAYRQPDGTGIMVALGSLGSWPVVAGAPYSGEWRFERMRIPGDGTSAQQLKDPERIWRDSQGRTRSERTMAGGFILVEIDDPVGGVLYFIDHHNQAVHRFAVPRGAPPAEASMPKDAQAQTPRQIRVGTQVQAANSQGYFNERLGERNVEGQLAEGTRTTSMLNGKVGHTWERWYARELHEEILLISAGPKTGDTTTRLRNIVLGEPDASLFLPPVGYVLVEEKESFTIPFKRP